MSERRIKFGPVTDSDPKRIKFGPVETKTTEVLKTSDELLVDPNLFRDQVQTDGNLCVYLTLAAQIHLCTNNPEDAKNSKKIIQSGGLKRIAQFLRSQIGSPSLDTIQTKEELEKRSGMEIIKNAGQLEEKGYLEKDQPIGAGIAQAIKKGKMLPSIILIDENHAVLGIGVSADSREIIVWDALLGQGNPRLRRLPINRDHMGIITAAKINPIFQF